jgi:hypothetical protein
MVGKVEGGCWFLMSTRGLGEEFPTETKYYYLRRHCTDTRQTINFAKDRSELWGFMPSLENV